MAEAPQSLSDSPALASASRPSYFDRSSSYPPPALTPSQNESGIATPTESVLWSSTDTRRLLSPHGHDHAKSSPRFVQSLMSRLRGVPPRIDDHVIRERPALRSGDDEPDVRLDDHATTMKPPDAQLQGERLATRPGRIRLTKSTAQRVVSFLFIQLVGFNDSAMGANVSAREQVPRLADDPGTAGLDAGPLQCLVRHNIRRLLVQHNRFVCLTSA